MTRSALIRGWALGLCAWSALSACAGAVHGTEANASANLTSVYSETAVAINPADPRSIVIGANHIAGDGAMPVFTSADRGATFIRTTLPSTIGGTVYHSAADPSVAFDSLGNAYYCFIVAKGTLYDPYHPVVATLKAGQTQWTGPLPVAGTVADDDKPYIAVDASPGSPYSGRVYVVWDRNASDGSQSIMIARSADGTVWQPPVRVDDAATSSGSVIYAMPATGPYGEVYVVWNDYGGGAGGTLLLDKSLDGGASFGVDVKICDLQLNLQPDPADPYSLYTIPAQPTRGIAACPSIGVDTTRGPRRGWVYVCYGDRGLNRPSDDVDVFVRHSVDGGATWSDAVRVNDDTGATSQFFPWMSVDPVDGSLNISFYDCRNDTANRKAHVYYARSRDGGVTFEPNDCVTTTPSDESTGTADPTGNDYGDYAGIAAYGGQIVPAWTDSRGGYNQTYTEMLVQPALEPAALSQTALGLNLPPDATLSSRSITLNAILGGPSAAMQAEWEVKPAAIPFDGTGTTTTDAPVFVGAPMAASLSLTALPNGEYHWRVRALRTDGLAPPSQWVAFSSGVAFRIGGAAWNMSDAARALAIAAGLARSTVLDAARLDVAPPSSGIVTLVDAVHIARAVAGLETIP
ncbi:MAG TPA: sialidase family protein [Armatimonadota bacterium]|jgi:hypothetical protein